MIVALGMVAVAISPACANTADLKPSLRPWTGDARPGFTLDAVDGRQETLESHRGHIVLVHFFATWCEPCVEELPALRRLAARAPGLRIVAISVAEVDDRVRRFLTTTPVNFPVLLDRDRAVAKKWQVDTLPSTFVLDADLKPRLAVEADFDWDRIDPARLSEFMRTGGTPAIDTLYHTQ